MDEPNELTLEQKFYLHQLMESAKSKNKEELLVALESLIRQNMIKENFLKNHLKSL